MSRCYWCPFSGCYHCEFRGEKPGVSSGNAVESDLLDPRDSVRNPGAWTNRSRRSDGMTISATTHTARPGGP